MSELSKDELREKLAHALNSFKLKDKLLTHCGVFNNKNGEGQKEAEKLHALIDIEDCLKDTKFQLLFQILPLILKPSERKSIGSYSGKHHIEKLFKPSYITNGEFILATVALGYKYKMTTDHPNIKIYGNWSNTILISNPTINPKNYPFEIKKWE